MESKKPIIFKEVLTAVNQWPRLAAEIDIPQEKIQHIEDHLRTNDFIWGIETKNSCKIVF